VAVSALVLRKQHLPDPSVEYANYRCLAVREPAAAFCAELFMGRFSWEPFCGFSNRPSVANLTAHRYFVGILIALYILSFRSRIGLSIQPCPNHGARAVFAGIWTAGWLYFVAPVAWMMISAESILPPHLWRRSSSLREAPSRSQSDPCPFDCHFPLHPSPA